LKEGAIGGIYGLGIIIVELSQNFEAFYDSGQSAGPEENSEPLILSEDGKGIVMRTEDLREATRRRRSRPSTSSKHTESGREEKPQAPGAGGHGLQHCPAFSPP
jgi:hypothetical protein